MQRKVSLLAIYHLTAKVIGRSGGRSSVAAAAYRSAGQLRDARQGMEHDYTRKGGVVHTEIMAPANAPEWMSDRSALWNAVEAVEKRKDAQLAREIEVALPRELDRGQRLDLLRGFVQREFVDRGMIADLAVHETKARDGQGQPHAHVMLTMRELAGDGFGKKDRGWNTPDLLVGWRAAWACDANAALERAGRDERIDHRTLEAQREDVERAADEAWKGGDDTLALSLEKDVIALDREPEPKVGPAANGQEKRGIKTERGDALRAAHARNVERMARAWQQLEMKLDLVARGRAFVDAAKDRLDAVWERVETAVERIRERVVGGEGRAEPSQQDPRGAPDGLAWGQDKPREAARAEVEMRPDASLERDDGDDLNARLAAVLGRGKSRDGTDRKNPDLGQEQVCLEQADLGQGAMRDDAAFDRNQEQRDALLGRHRERPDRGDHSKDQGHER